MHLIDALGEKGNPLGFAKSKEEIHREGYWHKATHIWIYNRKGEILLQLRAKDKDDQPGLFDISAAGHVDAGEREEETAVRELKEELGLSCKIDDLKFMGIRRVSKYNPKNGWQNNEIDYIYFLEYHDSLGVLNFPDKEVERVKWIDIEKLKTETENLETEKKYVPHGEYYNFIIEKVKEELDANS